MPEWGRLSVGTIVLMLLLELKGACASKGISILMYIACVRIAAPGRSRYSILYSHPNASDLSDHLMGVPSLLDLARFHKCDVYSYDYSGYGISSGHPSESNQKADIRALYD
ncbi:hypothetical protein ANCDUO_06268, partial [Ancylostoma duodenale]